MRVPALLTLLVLLAPAPATAQAPDRSAPPPLGPPPSLELPPIRRLALSNGLPVILMEKHQVPLVQVNLVVRAGSAMDPDDRPGLASMTATMLDEGTGTLDALAFADAVAYLGADLSVSSGVHSTSVRLHTPLSKLEPALDLLAAAVLRPAFPAEELDRQVRQRITSLIQARDEPRALATVAYDRALYGEGHPYGRLEIGTAAGLRALTARDLREFHDTWFRPNNAAVIVVGAVTEGVILPLLEAALSGWRAGAVPAVQLPEAAQVARREVILVDKPGAAQSEIRIGRIGVARATPDYFPLVVMNTILGGSFSSRLNQNLREDKGYTYGARSGFAFSPVPGPFTASAAVQTAVTDSALIEFMRELGGIREAVSDEEMRRGRNYVALRFPGRFETVAGVADQLEDVFLHELPPTYYNTYVAQVLAVRRGQVLDVARRHVVPDRVLIVVVGDRERIEAPLRALDLGPMRTLSVEDVMGPPPEVPGTP